MKNSIYNIRLLSRCLFNNIRYRQPAPSAFTSTDDYCAHLGALLQIIEPEHEIRRTLPPSVNDGFDRNFRLEETRSSPATFYVELDHMYVSSCGYVFSEDGVLLADVSNEIGRTAEEHPVLRSGNLPRPRIINGRVAVLDVSHGDNYFHFLFDCLPRLTMLRGEEPDYYYVRCHSRFQRQYLELLGIDANRIICPGSEPLIKAECLCLPSLPGISGNPTRASADFLRGLSQTCKDGKYSHGKKKKIYISRRDSGTRVFGNEKEIQRLLSDRGFSIVQLADLDVSEQIRLFEHVSTVISAHGAGLANLVYAAPGTRVVELFTPRYFNVCYWSLCNLLGHQYRRLTASMPGWRNGGWKYYSRACIPLRQLRQLRELLEEKV